MPKTSRRAKSATTQESKGLEATSWEEQAVPAAQWAIVAVGACASVSGGQRTHLPRLLSRNSNASPLLRISLFASRAQREA